MRSSYLKRFPFDSALLRIGGLVVGAPGATMPFLADNPWEPQLCKELGRWRAFSKRQNTLVASDSKENVSPSGINKPEAWQTQDISTRYCLWLSSKVPTQVDVPRQVEDVPSLTYPPPHTLPVTASLITFYIFQRQIRGGRFVTKLRHGPCSSSRCTKELILHMITLMAALTPPPVSFFSPLFLSKWTPLSYNGPQMEPLVQVSRRTPSETSTQSH